MQLGEGLPFPRPGRYILAMEEVPDEPDGLAYPVIDLHINGDFQLQGDSGANELGRSVVLDVIQYLDDDYEFADVPGIEYRFTFKMVGFDDYRVRYFWPWTHPGGLDKEVLMNCHNASVNPLPIVTKDDTTLIDIDWPVLPVLGAFSWKPMSECYTFPLPPPPDLMAEFNGDDAYIALDHSLPSVNSPFIIEARIRLHDVTTFWPLLGIQGAGGFCGMDGADTIFGSHRLTTSWTPVLDEWFDWRLEFEQVSSLNLRTFINDVEVDESTIIRQQMIFNRLGVYRRSVSGTIWANMDMQNFRFITGDAPSTDVMADLPCILNALDLSAEENHGTPFNMDLPAT